MRRFSLRFINEVLETKYQVNECQKQSKIFKKLYMISSLFFIILIIIQLTREGETDEQAIIFEIISTCLLILGTFAIHFKGKHLFNYIHTICFSVVWSLFLNITVNEPLRKEVDMKDFGYIIGFMAQYLMQGTNFPFIIINTISCFVITYFSLGDKQNKPLTIVLYILALKIQLFWKYQHHKQMRFVYIHYKCGQYSVNIFEQIYKQTNLNAIVVKYNPVQQEMQFKNSTNYSQQMLNITDQASFKRFIDNIQEVQQIPSVQTASQFLPPIQKKNESNIQSDINLSNGKRSKIKELKIDDKNLTINKSTLDAKANEKLDDESQTIYNNYTQPLFRILSSKLHENFQMRKKSTKLQKQRKESASLAREQLQEREEDFQKIKRDKLFCQCNQMISKQQFHVDLFFYNHNPFFLDSNQCCMIVFNSDVKIGQGIMPTSPKKKITMAPKKTVDQNEERNKIILRENLEKILNTLDKPQLQDLSLIDCIKYKQNIITKVRNQLQTVFHFYFKYGLKYPQQKLEEYKQIPNKKQFDIDKLVAHQLQCHQFYGEQKNVKILFTPSTPIITNLISPNVNYNRKNSNDILINNDQPLIEQAFTIALRNSIKYAIQGSKLQINIENQELKNYFSISIINSYQENQIDIQRLNFERQNDKITSSLRTTQIGTRKKLGLFVCNDIVKQIGPGILQIKVNEETKQILVQLIFYKDLNIINVTGGNLGAGMYKNGGGGMNSSYQNQRNNQRKKTAAYQKTNTGTDGQLFPKRNMNKQHTMVQINSNEKLVRHPKNLSQNTLNLEQGEGYQNKQNNGSLNQINLFSQKEQKYKSRSHRNSFCGSKNEEVENYIPSFANLNCFSKEGVKKNPQEDKKRNSNNLCSQLMMEQSMNIHTKKVEIVQKIYVNNLNMNEESIGNVVILHFYRNKSYSSGTIQLSNREKNQSEEQFSTINIINSHVPTNTINISVLNNNNNVTVNNKTNINNITLYSSNHNIPPNINNSYANISINEQWVNDSQRIMLNKDKFNEYEEDGIADSPLFKLQRAKENKIITAGNNQLYSSRVEIPHDNIDEFYERNNHETNYKQNSEILSCLSQHTFPILNKMINLSSLHGSFTEQQMYEEFQKNF